ncbi:DUF6093 family protein [Nocardioides montaniterrae]
MSFVADAIAVELPFLRAEARARMTSICTIRRRSATRTTGADGMDVNTWDVTHTDLPVRISGNARGAASITARSERTTEFNRSDRTASLPYDTTDLMDGDLIEVIAGESAGTVWRIVEADWQDQATARRVPVDAVDRPEEW